MGNSGSGPVIVEADSSPSKGNISTVPIDILQESSRLQPVVGASDTATNQIQGGIIAGFIDAYAIADDTLKEIDNLAVLVTQKFNEINMTGLNLDGKKGTQMFTVSSLKAVENPTNRSNVGVAVFITDPSKITSSNYNVIYDQKKDLLRCKWHNWKFCNKTGKCLSYPLKLGLNPYEFEVKPDKLKEYNINLENDKIFLIYERE